MMAGRIPKIFQRVKNRIFYSYAILITLLLMTSTVASLHTEKNKISYRKQIDRASAFMSQKCMARA